MSFAASGFSIRRDFLPAERIRELRSEAERAFAAGRFRPARIGAGETRRLAPETRSDQLLWLDECDRTPAVCDYLERIEALRLALNEELFCGLFDFEAHFTVYPAGASYRRHLDRPRGSEGRLVSCILYLNDGWREEHGGQLRLYLSEEEEGAPHVDVLPEAGTFVAFLSERFWHEVLPTARERLSLTGWLRRR